MFVKKKDNEGNVIRYKARLVVCGNEQKYGIDFKETFTEVMDTGMFHVMAAIALIWGKELVHKNMSNAYVKADAEEGYDIFMHQPQGRRNEPGKVL